MDIKNMDRREFLRLLEAGAVTFGSLGIATGALAQQRLFKVAYWMGPKHSLVVNVFEPLVKNLNAANLGFNAKIFPAGQVGGGGPPQAYQRMVNGISHVELHLPGYTSSQFPRTLVMEIPLQHENNVVATKAINAIFDKHLKSEYKGVKVLGLFGIDVPVVMTKKEVRTPDDLKGMKLRTPSANQADVIRALGAVPVAMPMPATYQAVEKGTVEGSIVGISVVKSYKLVEVVKNFTVGLPFGYSPILIGVNERAYNALDAKQKAKFDELTKDINKIGAEGYLKEHEDGIAFVKSQPGAKIIEPTAEEKAKWVSVLEGARNAWIAKFEKQGLPYKEILKDYMAAGKA